MLSCINLLISLCLLLFPKCTRLFAKDYRPITCCTMLFKIITKVLTNWLSLVIHEVVNSSQARFIPQRFIVDNILLATELIRGYSRSNVSLICVIKVDIKKAYDSVGWPFLETMMLELGFPTQ